MVRSLYCGISGLRNHQVALDVTGNNIANVNTTGFKSGRVTFEESMAQLLKGATRPPGNAGGTNPMQVGLGMSVGSIDTIMTQGNLQSTGQITDLALEGRAFFAYSSGEGMYFSRNGALQFDSTGRLVAPTNGYAIQGMMAAPDGTYPAGSRIGDIRVPFGEKSPARATTDVGFQCNLDSDSSGLGTVLHTNRFLATAGTDDLLLGLSDENGNDLGILEGDVITISATDPSTGNPFSQDFVVGQDTASGEIWTLGQLAAAMQNQVLGNINTGITVGVGANGALNVDMSGAAGSNVADLTIRTNRPISDPQVADLFSWDASLVGGTVDAYGSSGQARTAAEDGDLLANVFDAAGRPLGFENGDEIRINGSVGGQGIDYDTPLVFSDDPATGTTMGMLVGAIQDAFNLPNTDGTADQNPSVQINPVNSTDGRLPEGAIVVRGQAELAFAIESMSVTATNDNNDATAPNAFTANMASTEIQAARDTTVHSTSIVVYDESGDAHTMTTTFTHSGEPSEWLWEVTMDGGERIIGGSQGRMTFGQDGTPSSFTYDDGSTSFRFNPMNGSNVVDIDLDVGQPGSLRGITQMRSPTTTAAAEQDGYTMGKLQEVSIDEYGEVSGVYSNGITKSIARIYVAEFNNPAGLMKRGDSMFAVSNNSGEAVLHQAGVGSSTKIKPGALEMSNVELASEFTTMITTQRGYQANARVITTSDSMLQELVQLVR